MRPLPGPHSRRAGPRVPRSPARIRLPAGARVPHTGRRTADRAAAGGGATAQAGLRRPAHRRTAACGVGPLAAGAGTAGGMPRPGGPGRRTGYRHHHPAAVADPSFRWRDRGRSRGLQPPDLQGRRRHLPHRCGREGQPGRIGFRDSPGGGFDDRRSGGGGRPRSRAHPRVRRGGQRHHDPPATGRGSLRNSPRTLGAARSGLFRRGRRRPGMARPRRRAGAHCSRRRRVGRRRYTGRGRARRVLPRG